MDALNRLAELIEQDPNMSTKEMGKILVDEGYAKSENSLHNFFSAIGIDEERE